MEGNQMNTDGAQPFELLVANDAVAMCEKLEIDFRNKGDYCHNNIGSKTSDDWEQMDKFLVDAAYEIQGVHDCVKSLVALYSRQKLRQCDIGTPEEQAERFKKFCFDHQAPWHGCTNCPVLMSEKCALAWAQMPYDAPEGAGE